LNRLPQQLLMRIEMKLIQSAFLVTTLLAVNVSAQPAPPSPTSGAQPAPLTPTNRPTPIQLSTNRPPPRRPPGLTPGAPTAPVAMPDKDKLSYAIGFNIASSIKRSKFDVDVDTVATAMKDVFADRPARLNEQEVKDIMHQLSQALPAKLAAENKSKGDEFLAKNAKDPAVKTLPNGLQYKILKDGTGDMPKSSDSVVVSYKGSLVDGTVFDHNDHFPTPVTGRTIKGWSEILPLMKTGTKWQVVIPPELGYGARGFPPKIGPESVLIFDMELLSIAPPSTNSVPAPGPAPHASAPPGPAATNNTPVVSGQIIKVPSADELKKGAKIEVITNVPNNP
jgi:FKBP-type peptidyl-prolyl cis-trans isomerase